MCFNGQKQSPIDIDPAALLFDPNLRKLEIDKGQVSGILENTGTQLIFSLDSAEENSEDITSWKPLTETAKIKRKPTLMQGGPFGKYTYVLDKIFFHFGNKKTAGSEHKIANETFVGEVQLIGYNSIYNNFSEAKKQPHGLAAIAVVIDTGSYTTSGLKQVATFLGAVMYKGKRTRLKSFPPLDLLPETHYYVTYEGSLTFPGCDESVTWVLVNKPIYIDRQDLKLFGDIHSTETKEAVPAYMAGNVRPVQAANHRLIRTNINFKTQKGNSCPTMYKNTYYRANPNRKTNRVQDVNKRNIESSFFDNSLASELR